jgi:two-component system cell cycle response regulator
MIVGGSVRERWQVHSPTCATPVDRPEVQILDGMMPGMGGIEGCQKLSESNERPYAYVLLRTGRSRKEDLLAGLESGADDYLAKPFDAQELRARLHVGQRILDLQDKRIAAGEELSVPRHARAPDGRGKSRRDSGYFRAQTLAAGARRWVFRDRPRGSRPLQICERQLRALGGRRCVTRNDPADDAIGASLRYGGRYGGQKFLIVAPSSDALGAQGLYERIRRAIAEQAIAPDSVAIAITVSFGVAASSEARPLDPQEMLKLADDALRNFASVER